MGTDSLIWAEMTEIICVAGSSQKKKKEIDNLDSFSICYEVGVKIFQEVG